MTENEYRFIENSIRELAQFVYDCRKEDEKTQYKRFFYNTKSVSREEKEQISSELRAYQNRRCGHQEDQQLNKEQEQTKKVDEIFTKKEILKMPRLKDFSYRYREYDRLHEFRYRKNNIYKSFSSTDFLTAKKKALTFCKELNQNESALYCNGSVYFVKFSEDYLKNVKKVNVTQKTFDVLYNRYTLHIRPAFEKLIMSDIKGPFIQSFLNGIINKGLFRTAEDCYYLLKNIFQYALENDVIQKNPVNVVKIPLHRRSTGTAIPMDLEKQFVNDIIGHKYELNFIILLYTGCRPCELDSLTMKKDGFLTFRNRKQHNNNVVFKDIPITPMLEPYIERIKKAIPLQTTTELAKIFSKLVPGYKMYSLRHTFATRCQTCGVPQEIVGRWLGHKSSVITDTVYTHFSLEYYLEQAKKVVY